MRSQIYTANEFMEAASNKAAGIFFMKNTRKRQWICVNKQKYENMNGETELFSFIGSDGDEIYS